MASTSQVCCCFVNWHSVPACAVVVFKWLISRQMTSRKKERKKENEEIALFSSVMQLCNAKIWNFTVTTLELLQYTSRPARFEISTASTMKIPFSGAWLCVVWYIFTIVGGMYPLHLWCGICRQHVALTCRYMCTRLHDVISQKTWFIIRYGL